MYNRTFDAGSAASTATGRQTISIHLILFGVHNWTFNAGSAASAATGNGSFQFTAGGSRRAAKPEDWNP
jgi:hypothetical protein